MTPAMSRAFWSVIGAIAVLWPGRLVGPLDGAPLDGRLEAVVVGLVLPSLWWLDRRAVTAVWVRVVIVALLAWKALGPAVMVQQGLCATMTAAVPLHGINQGIPIEEPFGALRSWDLRADLTAPQPSCTAILTRPLPTQDAFPAWFLNVTDPMRVEREFTMRIRGSVVTNDAHTLDIAIDRDVMLSGHIDGIPVEGTSMALAAGVHQVDLSLALTGNNWRFEPTLDGRPLWDAALVTTSPAGAVDRLVAAWGWLVPVALTGALVAGLAAGLAAAMRPTPVTVAWLAAATGGAIVLALMPNEGLHRAAGLIGLGAVAVPVPARLRNLRGAFLLVGVPWLAFFAALSLRQVGHFSVYSPDDWLTYQVAGHRIYMQGYWLEGGNAVFDFQPFYRWMTGALHLVFGDSSVGEVYWDAACLLMGALLAFHFTRRAGGFRWGIAAAAATLATFTLGTPWYFFGRGLSEIAAAGWAFLAVFFLLRARRGSLAWAVSAAVMAVLMFYTRLNHLLFAGFLLAACFSLRTPATVAAVRQSWSSLRRLPAAVFAGGFVAGVLFFMWRTWHYTGVFSLFHGTSLKVNDTGLRPWTLLDGEAWSKVAHSLATLVLMNEPPRPDPRALIMVAGAVIAVAALLQTPVARRLPATVVIIAVGASVSAFFAHAHGYPGRFSIHLVPFASALVMIAGAQLVRLRAVRA
ncbi:MAG: hypothetical protein AB7N29_20945 [Vicinamibacterales bacterium]